MANEKRSKNRIGNLLRVTSMVSSSRVNFGFAELQGEKTQETVNQLSQALPIDVVPLIVDGNLDAKPLVICQYVF